MKRPKDIDDKVDSINTGTDEGMRTKVELMSAEVKDTKFELNKKIDNFDENIQDVKNTIEDVKEKTEIVTQGAQATGQPPGSVGSGLAPKRAPRAGTIRKRYSKNC